MTLEDHLITLGACPEARKWARDYPTLRAAWDACERADWLLWYASRRDTDHKLLMRAACACVRTALHHVPPGEDRPRAAIELAERWASGDSTVTPEALRRSAAACAYAVYATAAACATAAVYATAAACAYAVYDDARLQAHRTMCCLIRDLIPCPEEP